MLTISQQHHQLRQERRGDRSSPVVYSYTLTLSGGDYEAIRFAQGRYGYADALLSCGTVIERTDAAVTLGFCESDAWEVCNALDAEDGWLPLLRGYVAETIREWRDAIV